jgi:hypothetical protein
VGIPIPAGLAAALIAILCLAFAIPAFAAVTLTSDFDGGNVAVISVSEETDGPIYERHGIEGDVVLNGKHVTIEAKINSPCHNWFFFRLDGVRGKTVTVNLHPWDGAPTNGMEKNDFRNWHGLHPVMTYGSPEQYETYEWFTKDDQGRWISGDVFRQGDAGLVGTGNTPQQDAISAASAGQFLSEDGKYWQPWRDIVDTQVLDGDMTFRLTQHFTEDTVWVAMRVPYTYTYLQTFLARLKAANLSGVVVDEIGTTPGGRKLQIVRSDDPTVAVPLGDLRTILVIAREHATEHASSWMAHGGMTAILGAANGAALHANTTWVFIPIQDPDGSAMSTFDRLTNRFRDPNDPKTPSEIFDYARYFADHANSGRTLDATVTLHNLEAGEGPNVYCPFVDMRHEAAVTAFNHDFFEGLRDLGYATGLDETAGGRGMMSFRLYAWCALRYGSFDLAFEGNDRCPTSRLALTRMERMGGGLAACLAAWRDAPGGSAWHAKVRATLTQRAEARTAYFADNESTGDTHTRYELIKLGY